jgi:DNA (cytosine-5)-methyltransferase 1
LSLTYASLFTGGGLSDIGAKTAGLHGLWGIEMEQAIAACASANLGHEVIASKIEDIDPNTLARPDVLLMSPVCTRASLANQSGGGESSIDLTAASAAARFIEALKPDYIVIENVAQYKNFESFKILLVALEAGGYFYDYKVLNAADIGVPQSRRRLICRAVKKGLVPILPAPAPHVGWYGAIEDLLPALPDSKFADWQLRKLTESGIIKLNDNFMMNDKGNNKYGSGVRTANKPGFTIINVNANYPKAFLINGDNSTREITIRLDNQPCFTMAGLSKSRNPLRSWLESGRVVQFNERCLARLQTLPDSYILPEKRALAAKIIGNGVPCLMMQKIIENLIGG